MNIPTASSHPGILRSALSFALAIGGLTALSPRAHAFDLDPITISAPTVKTIGHEPIEAPIEQVTVKATVKADPEALKYDSGVALLKEKVVEAAYKACSAADPFTLDDSCVYQAVRAAQPQVRAVIARASISMSE